jgi:hypothetical protein
MSDTIFVGICDGCQKVRQFLSEQERNDWESSHDEHEESDDA